MSVSDSAHPGGVSAEDRLRSGRAPTPGESVTPDLLAHALHGDSAWAGSGDEPIEWLQTHISHVFLTHDRVFKLRKAVALSFLDFSSRDARNRDCEREISLNRRLAPDVYLGMCALEFDGERVELGPLGDVSTRPDCDHVVVMRRLPDGQDALAMLERGELEPAHLDVVAELLARFHDRVTLGHPAPWSPEEWFERTTKPVLDCMTALSDSGLLPGDRLSSVERTLESGDEELARRLEARRRAGRAVDAHGDLHLDHVWFEDDRPEPSLIDCIEFGDDLRQIDRASEVAFLAMDLTYRDRRDLAEWFLASYAMRSDDYGLFSVVDYHTAYRGLVRAKVAALAAAQESLETAQREAARESARRHFALAERMLEGTASGEVVVLCGTVGSGKSTVARYLAQRECGIPIASDRVRKALAGLDATDHLGFATDEGLYSSETTANVYEALLERAAYVVESGRTALLDASFARAEHRTRVREWAAERGVPARLIEVRCSTDDAMSRLERRASDGGDASDAGPEFLSISQERFEPPDEWPEETRHIAWT